ncbi:MAG: DUF2752 domain-containing protein [Pyrinomonadaceae bacterium]|nr:DUF2752 domain-containing protein [Pyrinomonadaceae bacterium]
MSTTLKIGQRRAATSEQQAESVCAAHCSLHAAHPASVARRRAGLVLLGLTAMFVAAAVWHPPDEGGTVFCPFRALTDYPCPGCGMTRAFCALAHFEFWRAIKFNALSPLLFLAALLAWASAAATVFRVERARLFFARLPRPTPTATKVMLAFVMLWWAARLAIGF